MKELLIIGTTNGKEKEYGILSLKKEDGAIFDRHCYEGDNAGILCLSHDGKRVYVANESRDYRGKGSGGGIVSYQIKDDQLIKLNDSLSYGSRPAYLALTKDDRYLIVANHGSHSSVTIRYEM